MIYESDQRIGAEPISAKATETMAGRAGRVICNLVQTDSTIQSRDACHEIRLQADVAFKDPTPRGRDTYLRIESEASCCLYAQVARREVVLTSLNKVPERFTRWEANIGFEERVNNKSVSAIYHAALLDREGRLLVCSTYASGRQLAAPEDTILSACKLDFVAYEFEKQ